MANARGGLAVEAPRVLASSVDDLHSEAERQRVVGLVIAPSRDLTRCAADYHAAVELDELICLVRRDAVVQVLGESVCGVGKL